MHPFGLVAGDGNQTADGIFVHLRQAYGLPYAAAFGHVLQDGNRLFLRQAALPQRGAFPLREVGFARTAVHRANLALLAAPSVEQKSKAINPLSSLQKDRLMDENDLTRQRYFLVSRVFTFAAPTAEWP